VTFKNQITVISSMIPVGRRNIANYVVQNVLGSMQVTGNRTSSRCQDYGIQRRHDSRVSGRSGLSGLARRLLNTDFIHTLALVRRRTRSLLLPSQDSLHVRADPTTIFKGEIGFGCRVPEFYRDSSGEINLMGVECSLRLGYCKGT
jgi:hypothetical protein